MRLISFFFVCSHLLASQIQAEEFVLEESSSDIIHKKDEEQRSIKAQQSLPLDFRIKLIACYQQMDKLFGKQKLYKKVATSEALLRLSQIRGPQQYLLLNSDKETANAFFHRIMMAGSDPSEGDRKKNWSPMTAPEIHQIDQGTLLRELTQHLIDSYEKNFGKRETITWNKFLKTHFIGQDKACNKLRMDFSAELYRGGGV